MDFISILKGFRFFLPIAGVLSLAACNSGEIETSGNRVTVATPNSFLTFFNAQNKLPSGNYKLVVATSTAGQSGTFSLKVTRHDGSGIFTQNGQWVNSVGPSATPLDSCNGDPANVCFALDMQTAEGLSIEVSSDLSVIMYLMDDSDNAVIVAEKSSDFAGETVFLEFAASDINQQKYATAYYQAVDPGNARDSLQKFITLHGLDSPGPDAHVTYRNSKDLGYGRDTYMRSYPNSECGGQVIVMYVKNFSVQIVDGIAYGPVNLAAVIGDDFQHHFGTNAIEFSRGLTSAGDTCSADSYAKFFSYQSDYSNLNSTHPRLLTVDLDGRGEKAIPQPCISCHGGRLKPLDRFDRLVAINANDDVSQIGDVNSYFQILEVDTFEFSAQSAQSRDEQEENIRLINSAVFCSFPGSLGHPACSNFGGGVAAVTDDGEWNADFSREVLLGWYDNKLEVSGTKYDNSAVPSGWIPSPGDVPEGADTLFRKVIAPHCFTCHGRLGHNLGTDFNASGQGSDIDFSSYKKFISYAEENSRLVFEDGTMPMSLLNYNIFWSDPENAELLATFLAPNVSGFVEKYVASDGKIMPPSGTIARAGADRVSQPDSAIRLNGHGSLFADEFHWSVITLPEGASAILSNEDSGATDFVADSEGVYEVQLTASSSEKSGSDTDTLLIEVDSSLAKSPRSLTFYDDIVSTLTDCANSCHSTGGGAFNVAGVSQWLVEDDLQPLGIPDSVSSSPSLGLYEQVKSVIDLQQIELSPLLVKSAGHHHYGGQQSGFNSSAPVGSIDRVVYDLWVNWIAEGAVCGGSATQCPAEFD